MNYVLFKWFCVWVWQRDIICFKIYIWIKIKTKVKVSALPTISNTDCIDYVSHATSSYWVVYLIWAVILTKWMYVSDVILLYNACTNLSLLHSNGIRVRFCFVFVYQLNLNGDYGANTMFNAPKRYLIVHFFHCSSSSSVSMSNTIYPNIVVMRSISCWSITISFSMIHSLHSSPY